MKYILFLCSLLNGDLVFADVTDHYCKSASNSVIAKTASGGFIKSSEITGGQPINLWAACCAYGTHPDDAALPGGALNVSSTLPDATAVAATPAIKLDCLETLDTVGSEASFDLDWTAQSGDPTLPGDIGLPAAVQLVDSFKKKITGWFSFDGQAHPSFTEFASAVQPKIVNGAINPGQASTANGAGAFVPYASADDGAVIPVPSVVDTRLDTAIPSSGQDMWQYPILVRAIYLYKCPGTIGSGHPKTYEYVDGTVTRRRCAKAEQIDVALKFQQVFRRAAEKPQKTVFKRVTVPLLK
jgi:hypothetical protein